MTPHARVVVFDRDGTLVVDRNYLDDPAGLTLLPGAADALRALHARGHRMIVISNQSGVGRGLFTLERLAAMNERLAEMVEQCGAKLEGIYCCPHRPEEGCACRKPEPKLLLDAAAELGFDPQLAIVVGDKASDVELGRRVGAVSVLIADTPAALAAGGAPDHVIGSLTDLLPIIDTLDRTRTVRSG